MGGIGSGRCSSLLPEFITDARRVNVTCAPIVGASQVHRWADGGAVRLFRRSASLVEIDFTAERMPVHVEIVLVVHQTVCATQYLWICPACTTRRRDLYLANTGVACRTCLGLRYRTQYMTKVERAQRRVELARAALGMSDKDIAPRRRRNRWRKIHARRCRALAEAERVLETVIRTELDTLQRWSEQLRGRGGGA
jgi:hypothetical protein